MPLSISHRASFDTPRGHLLRWIGVLAGPLAWAAVLETNYAMSYVACEQGSKWMLHLAIVVAVVLVALAAYGAWATLPSAGEEELSSTVANPERTALVRARFVCYGALALSLWFMIVILAMEIPATLLQPCNP